MNTADKLEGIADDLDHVTVMNRELLGRDLERSSIEVAEDILRAVWVLLQDDQDHEEARAELEHVQKNIPAGWLR